MESEQMKIRIGDEVHNDVTLDDKLDLNVDKTRERRMRFAALAGSAGKRSGLTVDEFELGILVRPWSVSRLIILWAIVGK